MKSCRSDRAQRNPTMGVICEERSDLYLCWDEILTARACSAGVTAFRMTYFRSEIRQYNFIALISVHLCNSWIIPIRIFVVNFFSNML